MKPELKNEPSKIWFILNKKLMTVLVKIELTVELTMSAELKNGGPGSGHDVRFVLQRVYHMGCIKESVIDL